MTLDAAQALGHLPQGLRDELVEEFAKITRNYRERRWEAAELDTGRFCEIVYTILKGHTDGDVYPDSASKPAKFDQACRGLESSTAFSDSVRMSIPRVLIGLYDFRNRRGVGHVGGDVNANHMDATYALHGAQWVMAELVRVFHDADIGAAQTMVDALVDRTLPAIWEVNGIKRVLATSLSLEDKTLLLLYASADPVSEADLLRDLKQPRADNYRRVLARLDCDVMIEYSRAAKTATISPRGIVKVENQILPKVT